MVKWQLLFTSFSRLEQGKQFFLRDLELTLRPLISRHFESGFCLVYLSKLQHGTPMSISLNMSGMPLHFFGVMSRDLGFLGFSIAALRFETEIQWKEIYVTKSSTSTKLHLQ